MLALAFVSGASSLVFELLWIRALGLYFGTTVAAITTVVATYTAGIALGSLVIGRRADRSAAPLRLYSGIELAIGCSAVLVSLLLLHGSGPLSVLARLSAASGPLAGVTRALCLSAILFVPTTLMGGTLPVLARARTHEGDGGRAVGLIYAFNTAGAVVGALLPDALLVPTFGMTITALVAALGNFTVALVARRLPEPAPVTVVAAVVSEAARAEARPADPRARRLALLLFAVSGLCAMAYEVLWSRVLEHLVEGLVISFSVLLAVYLVAVALGSRLTAARADRSASPVGWAALCLGGTGLLALAPMALLPRAHAVIMGWFPRSRGCSAPRSRTGGSCRCAARSSSREARVC